MANGNNPYFDDDFKKANLALEAFSSSSQLIDRLPHLVAAEGLASSAAKFAALEARRDYLKGDIEISSKEEFENYIESKARELIFSPENNPQKAERIAHAIQPLQNELNDYRRLPVGSSSV